ncbi:MAG: N-acetylmuramic acid 6-phosphate etherase, partial [Microcystaceae cyanobacterium]
SKLEDRALRILQDLTQLSRSECVELLEKSDRRVKLALLMHWSGIDAVKGQDLLDRHQGNLREALTQV